MNNDLTMALDTAQELMGGGIPFWDAVFQGLDGSGTTARWKREEAEKKTCRPCRYDRSAIMKAAWKYRKGEVLTMSAALKRAWADARRSAIHLVA